MFNLDTYNKYSEAKAEYDQAFQYFNNMTVNASQIEIDNAIINLNDAIKKFDNVVRETKMGVK